MAKGRSFRDKGSEIYLMETMSMFGGRGDRVPEITSRLRVQNRPEAWAFGSGRVLDYREFVRSVAAAVGAKQ